VGFVTTYNKHLTQYFSQIAYQKKGEEIVNTHLKGCITKSLDFFKLKNASELPDHIIFYRDGVGETQRKDVLQKELPQLI